MRGTETQRPSRRSSPRPQRLTILYDGSCRVCLRARDWLLTQPCWLPVDLLDAGSSEARDRFGSLPSLGDELVVADDIGNVWIGPAAFLTCLWATVRYRPWAFLLSGPALAPFAERFFLHVSRRRYRWSTWLSDRADDEGCSWCESDGDGIGILSPDP